MQYFRSFSSPLQSKKEILTMLLNGQLDHEDQKKSNNQVDFLIKSHPLDAPSNYKLSDLTLKVFQCSLNSKL